MYHHLPGIGEYDHQLHNSGNGSRQRRTLGTHAEHEDENCIQNRIQTQRKRADGDTLFCLACGLHDTEITLGDARQQIGHCCDPHIVGADGNQLGFVGEQRHQLTGENPGKAAE